MLAVKQHSLFVCVDLCDHFCAQVSHSRLTQPPRRMEVLCLLQCAECNQSIPTTWPLVWMSWDLERKRPGKFLGTEQFWNNCWQPLHDNVLAYCLRNFKQFLASNWSVWSGIPPPPYLPDLALADCIVSSRRWNWPLKVGAFRQHWQHPTPRDRASEKGVSLQDFLRGFQDLYKRSQHCVKLGGKFIYFFR
jgi:hypothetical protein